MDTFFPLTCVRTSPHISLNSLQGHTLASDKDIFLTSVRYCNQGIASLLIVGTPTPNNLRSSWDFLPRISLDMLAGPTSSTFRRRSR